MADPVDVDVIILSWNRTAETIEAIESALAQENVMQRVLVVDQGSAPENLAQLPDNPPAPGPRLKSLVRRASAWRE